VDLRPGADLVLTTEEVPGSAERLPVSWDGLPDAVTTDDTVYLADGRIRLRVLDSDESEARCEVQEGGSVASHQGINLPGVDLALPAAGEADLEWVDFAIDHDIDLLAVSFVEPRPRCSPRW
jgi:pyruvate kinase